MKDFLLAATLLIQQPNFKESLEACIEEGLQNTQEDETERNLDILKSHGLAELGKFEASRINVNYYITASAQNIIDTGNFDIQGESFSLDRFLDFIEDKFRNNIGYFQDIANRRNINELHLVIEDFGEERANNISVAIINTRIIKIDVRRWHKLYLGRRQYLANLTSIHEFTHINNYILDNDEVKLHRELSAIIFESLSYIKNEGEPAYIHAYLRNVAGNLESPENILNEEYSGMVPLRHLAHYFIENIINGGYAVEGNKIEKLEDFAYSYLADSENGDKGFDDACLAMGIKDSNNNRITLEKVRNDLYQQLRE